MTRRAWLSFSVVVLFGAQAPLCASACLEQAAIGDSTLAGELPTPERSPCHESPPAPSGRGAPVSGEHECNCDRLQLVVPKAGGPGAVPPTQAPAASGAGVSVRAPVFLPRGQSLPDHLRGLPPPDILQLKSSLLL